MIAPILAIALSVPQIETVQPETTPWISGGLTFYGGAFVGQTLACGGLYTESTGVWAAVPIEWMVNGYVSCGDTLLAEFRDGRQIEVPILDTGCHLHHAAYDSGLPYVADFPNWPQWRNGTPTGTGRVAVRHKDGSWWTPPPLVAWGNRWCDGPLSLQDETHFEPLPRREAF